VSSFGDEIFFAEKYDANFRLILPKQEAIMMLRALIVYIENDMKGEVAFDNDNTYYLSESYLAAEKLLNEGTQSSKLVKSGYIMPSEPDKKIDVLRCVLALFNTSVSRLLLYSHKK
jgi:hypothetical protein